MSTGTMQGAQVLVTGGAGFIGSHLVDALLSEGARVRVLDNFATGSRSNLDHCLSDIELVEGDIRDAETCQRVCTGCRLVFHQAALGSVPRSVRDPSTSFQVNVQGTVEVLNAAREAGASRLVYASSSSVYGDHPQLPKEEGREGRPLSPYAATKQIDEVVAGVFSHSYGIETVGLRYFNIYGPRQNPEGAYAAVIPRFFKAALTGEPMLIHGDGEQSRDFTHVSDAVRANLLAAVADSPVSGKAFNVAAGHASTINQLAAQVARLCGSTIAPRHEPERPGDVRHSLADLSQAEEILGYRPTTGLASGLEASFDYYRSLLESA